MKKKYVSLNKNSVFQKAYKKGTCAITPVLIIYERKNYQSGLRVGVTTSKKIGNAVKRNRSKRIILSAFSALLEEYPQLAEKGIDFVFVARGKTSQLKMQDLYDVMKKQFLKMGLMNTR